MKCEVCGDRKVECIAAGNLLCGFCAADAVEMGTLNENEILDPLYQAARIKREYKGDKRVLNYFFPKKVKEKKVKEPELPECFHCGKPNPRRSSNWCSEECHQKGREQKVRERDEWEKEQRYYHNFLFQM